MNIQLKKTLDVTPALEEYIEDKIRPLEKFLQQFEKDGAVQMRLEVSRTTRHHNKGEEVYEAVANLELPGKTLRGEATASDVHIAIDEVRNILHIEIDKYREKHYASKNHRQKK